MIFFRTILTSTDSKAQYKHENYLTKTIKTAEEGSPKPKNRIEALYEHSKYLKKKSESDKINRIGEVFISPIEE